MASAPPAISQESLLVRIARAIMERERQKLGIPKQEQAAAESESENLLRRAQAAYYMGAGRQTGRPTQPPTVGSFEDFVLRKRGENPTPAQIAEDRAEWAKVGQTPLRETPPTGGSFEDYMAADPARRSQIEAGRKSYMQADDRPHVAVNMPGRLQPLVDDKGNVIGTFHNVTGEVKPVAGGTPGTPAALGGVGVRKSPLPAQERKDQAGLELALEGAQSLRNLLKLPEVSDTIGFFSGNLAALKRSTIGASPEVQELFRTSDRMAEFLLRALSGAQINESEYERLRGLIPNPREHISKFMADLDLFEKELESTLAKRFPNAAQAVPTATPDSSTSNQPAIPTNLPSETNAALDRLFGPKQ